MILAGLCSCHLGAVEVRATGERSDTWEILGKAASHELDVKVLQVPSAFVGVPLIGCSG